MLGDRAFSQSRREISHNRDTSAQQENDEVIECREECTSWFPEQNLVSFPFSCPKLFIYLIKWA